MIATLFALTLLAADAAPPAEHAGYGHAPRERGVGLGLFSSEESFNYRGLLDEIRALGATHVLIAWVWWQEDLNANVIAPKPHWSPSDDQIRDTIAYAKKIGLAPTAFPIVRLEKTAKADEWRGKIAPTDENAWWASYESFILHGAALASANGPARLSIGSELLSRESMRERWQHLIERVRTEAPNLELVYSANWDHYDRVAFWDLVDVVGLTAYFELTKRQDASANELAGAWVNVRDQLASFSKRVGRRIVITEVGYPSLDGGTMYPWDETRKSTVDVEEQRRGYEAFARAWSDREFLDGVYWWNWFGFGGNTDGNYTPRGKPAADVIRAWYRN